MEKIWLRSYPAGVPSEIAHDSDASLVRMFDETVRSHGRATAFESFGARLSYAETERLSRRLGAFLQSRGLKPGSRVAIMMPNLLQYPVALFAALRSGFIVVNCNPLFTERELEHQLEDSGAEALILLENFARTAQVALQASRVRTVIVARIGDLMPWPKRIAMNWAVKRIKKIVEPWSIEGAIGFRRALALGARARWNAATAGPGDVAFLQYTGGTTGVPKAAMLTHGNVAANVEQCRLWLKASLQGRGETVITALPLYHIFALTSSLMFFVVGARSVLIANPRDIRGFVKELKRTGPFAMITGVNTLFNALLRNAGFRSMDFSGLRICLGGGMPVHMSVAERWKTVTGRPLIEGYGLTEASPTVTINPLNLPDWNGSIGLPVPSTDIAIRTDAGEEAPLGEEGELCVRGPQVMLGYWNRPDETRKVFTEDGFLRTGDIARMDARGFLKIVDRKKDMILVSGFNVYPNEVEEVLREHPAVADAAVIGAPDLVTGESVKAIIVPNGEPPVPTDLTTFCRKRLASYKVPRQFEFRSELPKTNIGKVLRRALREPAEPTG